ncbi:ATP-dependent zinc metalloprotease FTSH 12, chloroplastic [Sesbania bispinosa]|nr:ATP-dependent zinc metalloprotease FTSH 12, chloroplastic [Sesbania bispinosa]
MGETLDEEDGGTCGGSTAVGEGRALAIGARGGVVTATMMGGIDGHSLLNVLPGLTRFAPNVVLTSPSISTDGRNEV